MNIYGYNRADSRFNKIGIPNPIAEYLRGFIKEFIGKNNWTEQNQFYSSSIALPLAGQPRPIFIIIPSIFELPNTTDEDEKLRSFEIGCFISPTEWVHILDGQELMQNKPIFREAFLHAVLFPPEGTKVDEALGLVGQTDIDIFVYLLSEQVGREAVLQKALGGAEANLKYLKIVENTCKDYVAEHNSELLKVRIRTHEHARERVEGLTGTRKEARG